MTNLDDNQAGANEDGRDATRVPFTFPGLGLIQSIWRRRRVVLICVVVCLLLALVRTLVATRVYQAVSRFYVSEENPTVAATPGTPLKSSAVNLDQQKEIVQSTAVIVGVLVDPVVRGTDSFHNSRNQFQLVKQGLDTRVEDQVISATFEANSARDAEVILKGVVDSYAAFVANRQKSPTTDKLEALLSQRNTIETDLKAQMTALTEFRKAHGTPTVDATQDSIVRKQLTSLYDALTAAQLDELNARASFDEASKAIAPTPEEASHMLDEARAQRKIIAGASDAQQMQSDLYQLQQRMKSLRQQYLPEHPSVRATQQRIDELNLAYVGYLQQKWTSARNKQTQLQAAIDEMKGRTNSDNSLAIEFERLDQDVKRGQETLASVNSQIVQLGGTQDATTMKVTVIEEAHAPPAPIRPDWKSTMTNGALIGLLLGCALTFLDRKFRSTEEVEGTLGLPILGVIPHMPGRHSAAIRGRRVHMDSGSELAEAYRVVRTGVFIGLRNEGAKTVLIASPASSEGKSTLASNLAIALTQSNQKVLLIDADFRRPMQNRIFELRDKIGLSTVLAGRETPDHAIQSTSITGLDILPTGPLPPNPPEILNGTAFTDMLETLASRYDYVVIDSPPTIAVTDSRILAAVCDATVMVVRAERTTRKIAAQAKDALQSVGANILGVVVNDAPRDASRYSFDGAYDPYRSDDDSMDDPAAAEAAAKSHASKALAMTVKQLR